MSTNQTPRTHSQAAKVAETVTVDELLDLFEQAAGTGYGASVTIFEPNKPARYTMCDRPRPTLSGRTVIASYEYCSNRTGFGKVDTFISSGRDVDPIFDFYNLGRIVRLEAQPLHLPSSVRTSVNV